ncbi:MAG: surface antigen [Gammaproteobacteria bacterium]|jgi:surface antigen
MKIGRIVMLCALVALTGCQTTGPNATGGGLIGAAAGGLLGAQFGSGSGKVATAVIGALAGSALGSHIGQNMDARDREEQSTTTATALESAPSGQSLPWRNDNSGNFGAVMPQRTWQQADGTYCREFTQTVTVGGQEQRAYGTACRQADGTWKIKG